MKFPSYPKYKDSGVEWLGEVPEHWKIYALKRLARLKSGEMITADGIEQEGIYPVFGGNGLRGYTGSFTHDGCFALIGRQGALCGNINYACGKFWASEHAVVVSPTIHYATKWLGELLRSMNLNQYSISAAQPGLSVEVVANLGIPVPPLPEQHAIAAFLDAQTSKIDTLIAKKRELIDKLKEKRAALITRTVTRGLPPEAAKAAGLDPNPKMKDSGVEWLGEVPEHWEVKRLKHISDTVTVGVVVNPSSYVVEEGVPFLLGGNIKELGFDLTNCNKCDPGTSSGVLSKSMLRDGDIVTVRVGYPGITAVIPPELEGSNCASVMIVRRNKRFHSKWLAYSINSKVGKDQIEIVQYGAAQKQFNISHAVDFSFSFPPIVEQRAIVEYLNHETSKLDALTAKVEAAITTLQEYRSALITAAVTGKIDVRRN